MTRQRLIIENNEHFFHNYYTLNEDTIVNCRLRLIPGEEHILTDLLERRVSLIPSATAQLASRSKVHQARIFAEYMLPFTVAVYDSNSLLHSVTRYNQADITRVVVKRDRKNGGIGIHRFESIEDVYNQAEFGSLSYPFVIQPYMTGFEDIRVILLDDYTEAYRRQNTANFRHNLHCGGISSPYEITDTLLTFCHRVMHRGKFPYAHVDLMVLQNKDMYLTEINLRGGLRGAKIDGEAYRKKVGEIHSRILSELVEDVEMKGKD